MKRACDTANTDIQSYLLYCQNSILLKIIAFSSFSSIILWILPYTHTHLLNTPTHTHIQIYCHRTSSPSAPSLKGSDLSALPVRSSMFKEFQAVKHTLTCTHNEQFSKFYLFILPPLLVICDKVHLSGVWLGGATSNRAAQARFALD